MRVTDFFLVLPTFVLALIIAPIVLDIIGTGEILGIRTTLFVIVIVIGITSWATTARIIRSQTMSVKERAFVDRARVIGSGRVADDARPHPAQRDRPDRRQRRPGLRRRDPDRDDPRVHRSRRPVRAVVGPDPRRRRRTPARRVSGRGGGTSRRASASSWSCSRSRSSAARSTTSSTRRRGRRPMTVADARRPADRCPRQADPDAPLLVVEDLKTYFTLESGTVKAVDGVSFRLDHGRGARHRRRIRLRQDDDRPVARPRSCRRTRRSSAAASS